MMALIKKEDSQVSKTQASFQKLSNTANSLNAASDQLTKVIDTLDSALKKLNLGVSGWVDVAAWDDDEEDGWSKDQLGYSKVNGKWGIALRTLSGNYQWPERDTSTVWPFCDAARELRIRAVQHIPRLIDELNKLATEMTTKLLEKNREVEELAAVIRALSNDETAGEK